MKWLKDHILIIALTILTVGLFMSSSVANAQVNAANQITQRPDGSCYLLNGELTQNLSSCAVARSISNPGTCYVNLAGTNGQTTDTQQVDCSIPTLQNTTGITHPPTVAAANAPAATSTPATCGVTSFFACIPNLFDYFLHTTGNIILQLCGLLLWVSGLILNTTLTYTVLTMKTSLNGLPGITLAWTVIRDFINMFFIFVLLWTAISTILDLGGNWKRTVGHLILVAIFINFSLFMTEALIDVSNLAAYGFYSAISTSIPPTSNSNVNVLTNPNGINGTSILAGGISGAIMQRLDLTQIYNTGNAASSASVLNSLGNFLAGTLGGSVFILVTAFVFLAMSILFIIRFVTLIFLLIFSPVAFIGGLGISRLTQYSKMWWEQLINNLLFAPAMMMMLWICLQMLSGLNTLGGGTAGGPLIPVTGAALNPTNPLSTMFNFIILIIFMIASIIIAKKAGAGGADLATKWAGKATYGVAAKIGQQTVGRFASNLSQNKNLIDREHDRGWAGTGARLALSATRSVSGKSFDLRNANSAATKASGIGGPEKGESLGYNEWLKDQQKKATEKNKTAGEAVGGDQKDMVSNLNLEFQEEARRRVKNDSAYKTSVDGLRTATNAFDNEERKIKAANKIKGSGKANATDVTAANEAIRLAKEAQGGIQKNVDKFREQVASQENKSLEGVIADIENPAILLGPELQDAIDTENKKRVTLGKPPIDDKRSNLRAAIRAVGIRRTTGIQDSDGKEINKDIVQNRRQRQAELVKNPTPLVKTGQFVSHAGVGYYIAVENREKIAKDINKDIGKELQKRGKLEDTLKSYLDDIK